MKKNWIQLTLSTLVIMALGAWLASHAQIKPAEVGHAIEKVGWGAALLAFACHLLQTMLVLIRYSVMTPLEFHPGFRRVVYAVGLGQAVNTYFPARAGDVLKCFLLSKGKSRLTVLSSAGLVVADRIVDVGALLAVAILWKAYEHPRMKEWLGNLSLQMGWGVGALVAVALFVAWFFLLRRKSTVASKWTGDFRDGMRCLGRPKNLVVATILAALAWSGEVFSIQILSASQGVHLSFSNCLFVLLALNFAVSLPLSFANLGPFEAAVALSLASFGMETNTAFAVATVHHGFQLIAMGFWGVVGLVVRPRDTAPLPSQST